MCRILAMFIAEHAAVVFKVLYMFVTPNMLPEAVGARVVVRVRVSAPIALPIQEPPGPYRLYRRLCGG